MTPKEITRGQIQEIADRYGTTPAELLGRTRPRRLLAARIELAKHLAARGYNGVQIGIAMNRDYTTAYFYLGRTTKQPSPRSIAPPIEQPAPKPAPKPRGPVRYAGWQPGAGRDYFATRQAQPKRL